MAEPPKPTEPPSSERHPPVAEPNRRAFVVAAAAGSACLCAAVAVPGAAFVGAPLAGGGKGGGQRFSVGNLDDLTLGVPRKVTLIGDEVDAFTRAEKRKLGAVWLLRTGPREVRALSAVCPHLGCSIDGQPEVGGKVPGFACPCHESGFDLAGARTSGPSPRAMDGLPLEVAADGALTVTWKRYRIGVAGQEELG